MTILLWKAGNTSGSCSDKLYTLCNIKKINWGKEDTSWVVTTHDTTHDKKNLLDFCTVPRSRKEMMEYIVADFMSCH